MSTTLMHPMWRGSQDGEPPLQEECVAFIHRQNNNSKPATQRNSMQGMQTI
jgi:hypothetical protein